MPDNLQQTKKGYSVVKTIMLCLQEMFASCGRKEIIMLFIGITVSILPSLTIFLQKRFFSEAEILIASPSSEALFIIVWVLAVWGALNLIHWAIGLVNSHAQRTIRQKVGNHMMEKLLQKFGSVRYEFMDTPTLYDKFNWVSGEILHRTSQVIYSTMGVLYGLISFASLGFVVITEDWTIALIILIGAIPTSICYLAQNNEEYKQNQRQSPFLRRQWYSYRMFIKRESIRDMRIGMFDQYLIDKWNDLSLQLRDVRYKLVRKYYLLSVLSHIFSYGSIGIALWMISLRILDPTDNTGIGSFILIYSAANGFQETITSIVGDITGISAAGKYIKDYHDLSVLGEEVCKLSEPIPEQADIVFEHVSFQYPKCDSFALQDIDLTIKQGEKVAIVGENGSGKSTFVSLLAGLYQPRTGRILYAGKDLKDCLGILRRATSFVFQDFSRYQMTVADNIRIGNMYEEPTEEQVMAAAAASGADTFIETLEEKYQTYLGTLEKGHADFSGGQWQKLAFARAIVKQDARLMILDEQTAALDPISEAQFYRDFKKLTGDRTAIMISHRLGATKLADRILVFSKGRIIEEGTHDELMQMHGSYYEMYAAQAQWYIA